MAKAITLAVILARGGSKRLPRKNILPLGGIPLIAHAIKAALASELITELIVSTDSEEIAEAARKAGAKVPFLRPAELALDSSTSDEALLHSVLKYEEMTGNTVETVVLLQPTSPFTKTKTINDCISILNDQRFSGALTVTVPSKRFEWLGKNNGGRFEYFLSEEDSVSYRSLKQLSPSGNVYAGRRSNLAGNGKLLIRNEAAAVEVDQVEAVDIDYEFDLKFAEFLLTVSGT